MTALRLVTTIEASATLSFDLSCNIGVHVESMALAHERAISGITTGQIGLGEEVTWRARHFGIVWKMTSKITEFEPPRRFVDEMQRGPFSSFRHEHTFEYHDGTTTMIDVVSYKLPFGPVGEVVDKVVVGRYLHDLLDVRNQYIKEIAEAAGG